MIVWGNDFQTGSPPTRELEEGDRERWGDPQLKEMILLSCPSSGGPGVEKYTNEKYNFLAMCKARMTQIDQKAGNAD